MFVYSIIKNVLLFLMNYLLGVGIYLLFATLYFIKFQAVCNKFIMHTKVRKIITIVVSILLFLYMGILSIIPTIVTMYPLAQALQPGNIGKWGSVVLMFLLKIYLDAIIAVAMLTLFSIPVAVLFLFIHIVQKKVLKKE